MQLVVKYFLTIICTKLSVDCKYSWDRNPSLLTACRHVKLHCNSAQEESPSLETARSPSESASTIVKPAWEHTVFALKSVRWNAPSSDERGIMISLSDISQLIATKIYFTFLHNARVRNTCVTFYWSYFSCQLFRIRSRASSVSPISSTSSSPQSVSPTFDQRHHHQYLPARKPYRCAVMLWLNINSDHCQ